MVEVDAAWAEAVRHLPLAGGLKDPERDPADLVAVVRTDDRKAEGVHIRRGGGDRARVMTGGGTLRLDRRVYPDLVIRKGDKVVALDRDSRPVFEVHSVDDRGHLRLICGLGEAS